jgi:hypothetical protein
VLSGVRGGQFLAGVVDGSVIKIWGGNFVALFPVVPPVGARGKTHVFPAAHQQARAGVIAGLAVGRRVGGRRSDFDRRGLGGVRLEVLVVDGVVGVIVVAKEGFGVAGPVIVGLGLIGKQRLVYV